MVTDYLSRDDAPIGAALWTTLDDTLVAAAKSQLSVRRLFEIEGPYGFGLKSVPLDDREEEDGVATSPCLPLVLLSSSFVLGKRDLAGYEHAGVPANLAALAEAAIAAARKEDAVLLNGTSGSPGLMNYPGAGKGALSSWEQIGTAANDLIEAVTALDDAGFHGPYVLGLSPGRYNLLLRRYEMGGTELEHLSQIARSIVKLPALKEGGVLVAEGRQYASIVIGRDLSLGFVGPTRDALEFTISESLALFVREPRAIQILA
jgi:uncharacterized linocin/CFP29 family protein